MKPSFLVTAMSLLAINGPQAEQTPQSEFIIKPIFTPPAYISTRRGGNTGDQPASYRKINQRKTRKNKRRAIAAGF